MNNSPELVAIEQSTILSLSLSLFLLGGNIAKYPYTDFISRYIRSKGRNSFSIGDHYSIMGYGSLIANELTRIKFILRTTKKKKKPHMFTDFWQS